jgi:GNAT superfamily N-acetyltransferase
MFRLRLTTPEDIDALVQLRLAFLQELGTLPPSSQQERFARATEAYFHRTLPTGSFLAWVAVSEEQIVGTSGLTFFERPPVQENFAGQEAYIMNMYTCPAYRGQGIATALLQVILEEVKRRGIQRVWLHTTEAGKPLYEKTGFVSTTSDMELLF